MASAKVYFADMREKKGRNRLQKMRTLLESAGIGETVSPGDLVAIKLHFGERGNSSYISPVLVRVVVDLVLECGGKPFLTDGNTLYVGTRANAVDHINTAVLNGFAESVVGAPLIISDGLSGRDYVSVRIDQKHFSEVKIGSAAANADALIALSHFKGHELTGFGGALKNVGMGLGSPAGKQMMHSDVRPAVDAGKCSACGRCLNWCPADAIEIVKEVKRRAACIGEACIGCGECTVVCPERAIAINWKTTVESIQEKIAEYALGAMLGKEGKCLFLNALTDITPDCDCYDWSDAALVPDIGFLTSTDIVAIDQASVDLFMEAELLPGTRLAESPGDGDRLLRLHGQEWWHQLVHAEKIGLGSRSYELTRT